MSSAVFSTTAATGRPFVFDEAVPESVIARAFQSTIKNQQSIIFPIGNRKSEIGNSLPLTPASRLAIRPAPEMVSSGIPALDALSGGLPRGCLTEICGPASSGRTTVLLAALAAATRRGEFCAVVDASDALDPQSAAAAGVELDRLLWVRCGAFSINNQQSAINNSPNRKSAIGNRKFHCLEQVLRATDLLLESGGFGLIVLDLADLPPQAARRIPLTTWFRFRRAAERTPTLLLAVEQQPIAGSCSSLLLQLEAAKRRKSAAHGASRGLDVGHEQAPEGRKTISDEGQSTAYNQLVPPTHTHLLTGLDIKVELICSRLERKPARSVTFATKTAWAG